MATGLLKILIVSNILGYVLVNGRPEGAPEAACEDGTNIVPGHVPNPPSTDPLPYSVDISSISSSGYIPGQNYTIILRSSPANRNFRGFMIQGRVRADDSPAGTFGSGGNYQPQCSGNTAATHTARTQKRSVNLVWTAPPTGTGCICFRYAFVDAYATYWANVTTPCVNENLQTEIRASAGGSKSRNNFTISLTTNVDGEFECSLDGGSFQQCSSGDVFPNLSVGSHTMNVRFTPDGHCQPIMDQISLDFAMPSRLRKQLTALAQFKDIEYSVVESDRIFTVKIEKSGTTAQTITLSTQFIEETAMTRSDFPAFQSAQAVIISPGPSMDIAVNLTINDDEITECNETFTLRLVSLDTVHLQIDPLRDQATVTIIDDDATTVGFPGSLSINEGTTGPVEVAYLGTIAQTFMVTVESYQCDGSGIATPGVDYEPVNVRLTFTPTLRSQVFNIMTIQDEIFFEGDERICLRLTNLTEPCPGYVIVGAGTEVVIAEDETALAQFKDIEYSVVESDRIFTVKIKKSRTTAQTVTLSTQFIEETAMTRSDFPAFQSAQAVIISPGPSMDIAVNLTIDDDEIVECNETFTLRLVSLDTVHLQIYPLRDQATVTIIDDDATTVGFPGSLPINEGTTGPVEVAYLGTIAQTFMVTVESYQCDGSGVATPGVDYEPVNVRLTFTPTLRSQVFNIMTIQDEIFEGDEHICLRLTNLTEPCPGSVIVGAGTEVVIAEDETGLPIIDGGVSQSPSVEKGNIKAKIGSPVYTVDGFNINIICNVTSGEPPITISWFHNNQPDQSRGNVSSIMITNATAGDVFKCRAHNKIGFDIKHTQINFIHKSFCIAT